MLSIRSDRCEFFSARACGSDRTPLEVSSCCGLAMDIVEVPLRGRYGHGKVANVDEHFAEAVRAHTWYLANGCAYAKIGGVTVYLHRYICALAGIPIARRIDHVNRDKLDCRLENLTPRPV